MRPLALLIALFLPWSAAAEPLTVDNGRLFITARINGVETEALLDSGAEASLVDPALAAKAGLGAGEKMKIKGTGGEQEITLVPGVRIDALGQTIGAADVVVLDMTDLSSRLIGRPTRAIIGRELFDAARIRIDLARADASVVDAAETPAGTRLALTGHNGIESVPVAVGEKTIQAELDYGNGSGVLIGKELAAELGLARTGTAKGGGIGGEVERATVVIPEISLAGVTFRDVPAAIDETESRGALNIGTSILRHFVVTVDFAGRAAWFDPVGKGD